MRDGLLKGDSVMAQAWKELLDGSPGTHTPDERAPSSDVDRRARKVLDTWDLREEGF